MFFMQLIVLCFPEREREMWAWVTLGAEGLALPRSTATKCWFNLGNRREALGNC